jgi:hypothetical protein
MLVERSRARLEERESAVAGPFAPCCPYPHTMSAVLILAETNDFARSIIGERLPQAVPVTPRIRSCRVLGVRPG